MDERSVSRGVWCMTAVLLLSALGCGGATAAQKQAQRDDDDRQLVADWEAKIAAEDRHETEQALAQETAPAKPMAEVRTDVATRSTTGSIDRKTLLATLAGGVGRFLQGVETAPAFTNGKFKGFRLVSFYENDPRMQTVDLVAGDVVTGVNGRPIERPEQALEVWESLKTAPELTVDYLRGTEVRQLKYSIH